jgi:hypothetical protein
MYLFLLAFFITVALAIWFVFISEASWTAKVLVGVLSAISCILHPPSCPLAGFFLRIAISIFVLFYQICQSAKAQ